MKVFVGLLLVAFAISAEAGMMGGPGGMGMGGGPPGGPGMGPPPFVQAIIAGKGKPFGPGDGGPPGAGGFPGAAGPPPFVQAIIAGKGKPFGPGAAAPAPAPEPAGYGAPPVDPMPAYIQSLLAAKAAAGYLYMPATIPMGPPPFIAQLIAAKNAAAAQQAAEEAAMAQQIAAAQQTGGGAASPVLLSDPLNTTPSFGFGSPSSQPQNSQSQTQYLQNILAQNGYGWTQGTGATGMGKEPSWFQKLLNSALARKIFGMNMGMDENRPIPTGPGVECEGGQMGMGNLVNPGIMQMQQWPDLLPGSGQNSPMFPPGAGPFPPFPMGNPMMSPVMGEPGPGVPYPILTPFGPQIPLMG